MLNNAKVLALVTARGGSKGVPGKNIRPLAGKPLLAWTIEAARRSRFIDRLVLSSDDPQIIEVAKEWGCDVPFVRPKELALDTTPGIEPVLHALDALPGFDYVVLLQPTSPFRQAEDIDAAIEVCVLQGAPVCVSVTPCDEHPYLVFKRGQDGLLEGFLKTNGEACRRQDYPESFVLNGAVYVADVDFLRRTRAFLTPETKSIIMPRERSVDIDTPLDFQFAEALAASRVQKLG